MKVKDKKDIYRIPLIVIAALIMAMNINTFVNAGDLFPAGAMGLTVLIQRIFKEFMNIEVPYTLINLILNGIPVYIGFRYIGKRYTLRSCIVIVLTGIFTDILPVYAVTQDILLISIFGGIANGFAISLALLMDSTTGGTDFLGIFLSNKTGMDSFNIVLGVNAVILCAAGVLFGWDKALYSIIFQYASTQVIHLLYKKYQQGTLFIVTNKTEEICEAIYILSGHGATILEGEGSYEHCERKVIYSVVSSQEARKVIREIRKIDPHAFINLVKTQEVSGLFYHKKED